MVKNNTHTFKGKKDKKIKDLRWFSKNFSKSEMDKYAGEWVAIENDKILSSGNDINVVIKEVEKIDGEPTFVKIAKKEEILIL